MSYINKEELLRTHITDLFDALCLPKQVTDEYFNNHNIYFSTTAEGLDEHDYAIIRCIRNAFNLNVVYGIKDSTCLNLIVIENELYDQLSDKELFEESYEELCCGHKWRIADAKEGIVHAYVFNYNYPEMSEFGDIRVDYKDNILVRLYN